MPLINPSNVLSNLLVVVIIAWVGFLVYSRMDKDKIHSAWEKIGGWMGGDKNAK